MAEAEKKGFFKSKGFKLILVWIALGVFLTVVLYAVEPKMEHACAGWAKEAGHPVAVNEDGSFVEGHHPCLTAEHHTTGFTKNLAASFLAITEKWSSPLSTAWNIPNFLILITLLWTLAKDSLNESLKTRRDDLKKSIAEAEKALNEAESRHAEYEQRLAEIGKDIESIRDEMRAEGETEKQKIIDEAQRQAERIGNAAEFTARQELIVARHNLREEAAKLAVEVAEDVIRKVITDDDRDRLLDEYLGKVMEKEN